MTRLRNVAATLRKFHPDPLVRIIAAFSLLFSTFMAAGADDSVLSAADTVCLGCHSLQGLEKQLPNGEKLSLHVSGEAFEKSVHRVIGCGSCHAGIDLASHPGATSDIASLRQYSIERAEACRLCHGAAFEQHQQSLHAARVREGNALAPVCTGCHGSHAVTPRTAYETCVRCHAVALAAHRKWLPNAGLHQEVVSCAACHAPAAPRMLDLRLYDGAADAWVAEKAGSPLFAQLAGAADANGDGLDAEELRKLLAQVNRNAGAIPKTLRGRVELRDGVEAHRLTDKAHAIRACDTCHRYGAEPFQNVAVSVTGFDGRPVRHPARTEILSSALAVESLPEFYAIGGTRSTILDGLLVLALLAGVGVPVGHMTTKWFFRRHHARGDRSGGGDDARQGK